jgi:serine/threonine-protein kinase
MPPEPIKQTIDIRREIRRCPECAARFSRDAVFCPFDGTRLEAGAFNPAGDPLVGSVVDGRYEVLEVLGEGGMGRVYRVRHGALGRDFALKVLRRDMANDHDLAARFVQEAKAAASVHHPHVVQISDFGQLPDGVPYFVMELLVGRTLGEIIKAGGPIPAARAVRLAKQVAAGLGAAHAAGVIHRDMKPENVFVVGGTATEPFDVGRARAMLGERVDVRVVDFGAAKVIGSGRMTRTGIVFGTPHYMSPEQASGSPVDHRADIYALGIIMYEMFTGRVPFEADTYMGVLTQHIFVQPIPPSQVSDAARELGALEEVTLRCLEKRPEDRYGSMDDLVAAIDAAAMVREDGHVEIASRRPSRPSRAPRPFSPMAMADELEPPTREEARARARRSKGHVLRNGVAVAGVTLSLSALATAWLRRGEGHEANVATPLASSALPPVSTQAPAPVPTPTQAPAPAPVVVSAQATPSGSTAAATAATARPAPRRPPARHVVSRDIDDVGDPFATPSASPARK